ncbi:MAG: hypothetical protein NDJ90_03545 [Oligoflexia bacterium]|nr:hypothetical protein [Oligoflexia bacterium]
MTVFQPSVRIKANARKPVKCAVRSCAWLTLAFFALAPSLAVAEEPLPDIEARTFNVKVLRKSRSGRVILFEAPTEAAPAVGRVLLLKRDGAPAIGMRVLKLYPDKPGFAAKRLRDYVDTDLLNSGNALFAVEKISDLAPPPPPPQTAADRADLRELEQWDAAERTPDAPKAPASLTEPGANLAALESTKEPGAGQEPPTPEAPPAEAAVGGEALAAETTAAETSAAETGTAETPAENTEAAPAENESAENAPAEDLPPEEEDESLLGLAIKEIPDLDPHRHWLSLAIGQLANGGDYFTGAGLRYGITVKKLLFLHSAESQDSLALEGGIFNYNITGYVEAQDSFMVLSPTGALRYNIYFRDDFGIFFYGGLAYHYATATSDIPSAAEAAETALLLSGITPALGAGLVFRVGPNWDARIDAGLDIVGLSLMLRF